MYLTIQRIVKVPKFYLTCELKPLKGLRICTTSLLGAMDVPQHDEVILLISYRIDIAIY